VRREDHLAVPYIVVMTPVESASGEWVCRAEYPEVDGCVGEALSPEQAIESLEQTAAAVIASRLEHGDHLPAPRPPLYYMTPEAERLYRPFRSVETR
jgi:predicted RNase H-like HicB family nuclease